ncbi:S41 family peptidase [Mycoplasmopsis agalactiae]|uniref:S41 family peptidase n=1 Tax=Mycoplasmopsis agalactiae TaxID=2110 RepID=UPI00211BFB9A|nr:S41 family peptidase [Mycoplasmopsis agalactiae]UUM25360.1 S41 family peptidase [Mycoplasmopsis agalactiae]
MTKKPFLLILTTPVIPVLSISCINSNSKNSNDSPIIVNPSNPSDSPHTDPNANNKNGSSATSGKDKNDKSASNVVPIAKIQKIINVCYVENENTIKSQKYIEGKEFKPFALSEFAKSGYRLAGYFLDSKFTKILPNNFKPEKDTKIFLKFEEITNHNFVEKDHKLETLVPLNIKNQSVNFVEYNDIDYIDLDQFVELSKDVLALNDNLDTKDVLYNGKLYKLKRSFEVDKTKESFTLSSIKQYISPNNEKENITLKSYIKFDYVKQQITVSGFDFFESVKPYEHEGKLEFYDDSNHKFNEFKIDLQKYKIYMLNKNGKIYLPFVMLNQLILGESENQFYFNGDRVYIFEFNQVHDNKVNDSKKKLLSNAKNSPIPHNFRDFEFNYLLFLLDNFYPIRSKNSNSYKQFLENYKENILSKDNVKHFEAINSLIYDLDDIHTKILLWGHQYVSDLENKIKEPNTSELKERRKRFKEYERKLLNLEISHNLNEKDVRYTSDEQTAIIKIDIFTRFLTDGIKKQLLEAKNKGAKNIVFDLTLNRGGSVQAAWEILGYLAKDSYKYNKYYPLSKDKVITNIKSKVDNKEFNFKYFILTSPINYSAGNMFAAVSKNNNLAKIIGYQSAGGASEVRISVLPTGIIIRRSGNYALSDSNFNSYELGVKPDIEFEKKNNEYDFDRLFDLDYIQKIVNESNK